MSLFDFADMSTEEAYDLTMPEVSEYGKDQLLALEKEVLVSLVGIPWKLMRSVFKKW